MRRLLLSIAALPFAALAAPPAWACSVVPSYRVPTTLELAARAETIAIVTIAGPAGTPDPDVGIGTLALKTEAILKGPHHPGPLTLTGMIADARQGGVPSDTAELRQPHPQSLSGGCVRWIFPARARLLVFFERRDDRLVAASHPFARNAEDVAGPDARWAQAVRMYVAIAALPASRRPAAMIARRDALREAGTPDARALADDLDVELRGPARP